MQILKEKKVYLICLLTKHNYIHGIYLIENQIYVPYNIKYSNQLSYMY